MSPLTAEGEVYALASALCDTSSHINLIPHAEQRPCQYHRDRARDVLALLKRRAGEPEVVNAVKALDVGILPKKLPAVDKEFEASRLDLEDLRRRVPPVAVPHPGERR